MAFDLQTFLPLSAQANSSAPRVFTYETTDSFSDIVVTDYFIDKINEIDSGDLLYSVTSDGEFFNVFQVSGSSISLSAPPNGDNSKTVDDDYTILPTDKDIRVTGARTITVPASLPNQVTVYAVDSVVTLSVTPENEPATIPAGLSYTLIANADASPDGYYVK